MKTNAATKTSKIAFCSCARFNDASSRCRCEIACDVIEMTEADGSHGRQRTRPAIVPWPSVACLAVGAPLATGLPDVSRLARLADTRFNRADDHGERQAERIIGEILEAFGLKEAQLLSARKGDWRKRLIGQRVRQETSVSLRWLGASARGNREDSLALRPVGRSLGSARRRCRSWCLAEEALGNVADHSRGGFKKSSRQPADPAVCGRTEGFAADLRNRSIANFLSLSPAPRDGYPPVHHEKANAQNARNVRYAHAGGQPRPPRF